MQLGGSPWPQDRASACPEDELCGPFHHQARESKSRARVEAYESLASRVSKVAKPTGGVQLEQGKMQRLGRTVLTCDGVTVEVGGRQILRDFSCEFTRGARVGVVGPNGAGKSTLLKALQQKLPLAAGEISCGETVAQRVDRALCPA